MRTADDLEAEGHDKNAEGHALLARALRARTSATLATGAEWIAPDASRGHDQGGVGLMGFTPTGSDAIVVAERPDSTSVTRTPWHCARQWRCHAKARITWTSLPTVAKRSPRASSPGSWSSGTSRARRSSRPSRSRRQAACPRMSRPSTLGNPRGVAYRDRHLDRTYLPPPTPATPSRPPHPDQV